MDRLLIRERDKTRRRIKYKTKSMGGWMIEMGWDAIWFEFESVLFENMLNTHICIIPRKMENLW